jgi:hypothetical protein
MDSRHFFKKGDENASLNGNRTHDPNAQWFMRAATEIVV